MDGLVIIMLLAALVVGVGLVAIMSLTKRGSKVLDKEQYQKAWLAIEQSVTNDSGAQQFAILQADKLLDKALRERGFSGQTMGERMTSASRFFSRREAVWAAHKLRNRIAHEDNVRLNPGLTRKALSSLKRALRDVGAL